MTTQPKKEQEDEEESIFVVYYQTMSSLSSLLQHRHSFSSGGTTSHQSGSGDEESSQSSSFSDASSSYSSASTARSSLIGREVRHHHHNHHHQYGTTGTGSTATTPGLPRPLSTVLEEGRASQGTLWNPDEAAAAATTTTNNNNNAVTNNQHHHGTPTPPSPKRPNIHTRRACRLWITFGFIGVICFMFRGVLDLRKQSNTTVHDSTGSASSSSFTSQSTISSALNNNNNNNNNNRWAPRYDYIIVGGGPAGIITAVKLARKFPYLSILLLEAGTVSQSRVLYQQQQPSVRSKSSSSSTSSSTCPSSGATSATMLDRNKFDIPLLWSGIAASTSSSSSSNSDKQSNPQHHYSWTFPGDNMQCLGRGLGGSGLINAMIYIRSLRSDWQAWNLTGWHYESDVLPHFMALERYMMAKPTTSANGTTTTTTTTTGGKNNPNALSHRGTKGPITTVAAGYGAAQDDIATLFIEAAQHAGLPLARPDGFNGLDDQTQPRMGVGRYEYNIRNGVRDSVAQALLGGGGGSRERAWAANLVIRTGQTVTRILTSTSTKTGMVQAHGVVAIWQSTGDGKSNDKGGGTDDEQPQMEEYLLAHDGDDTDTTASSQLVLSAGAILTPQLLGQSGIGPAGHVLDLPGVGTNCHDHPVVALVYEMSPALLARQSAQHSLYTMGNAWENYQMAANELQDLVLNATTVWTESQRKAWNNLGIMGTAGFSAGAFLQSPWATNTSPDLQVTVFPRATEPHMMRRAQQQVQESSSTASSTAAASGMLVTVALLQADARYRVEPSMPSNSATSNHLPQIWNYFDVPRMQVITKGSNGKAYLSENDVNRLAWGIQEVRRIFDAPPLADQLQGEAIPGRSIQDDKLRDWIHASVLPNAHWVGTTKMGQADDSMAVVDETLLVRGTTNMRIVDAGVIPSAPNGNIHSTVTVVASRGAELIAQARTQGR